MDNVARKPAFEHHGPQGRMRWARNVASRCPRNHLAIIHGWPEYAALIVLDRRRSLGGCISETTGNTSSITTTCGTTWRPETAHPALSRGSSPFQISAACRDSFSGRLAFVDRRFVGRGLQACCAAERRVISAFPRMEPRLESHSAAAVQPDFATPIRRPRRRWRR